MTDHKIEIKGRGLTFKETITAQMAGQIISVVGEVYDKAKPKVLQEIKRGASPEEMAAITQLPVSVVQDWAKEVTPTTSGKRVIPEEKA